MFVNNKHFANTVTVGRCRMQRMQTTTHNNLLCVVVCIIFLTTSKSGYIAVDIAKAIICVYKNEIYDGHFEHSMGH